MNVKSYIPSFVTLEHVDGLFIYQFNLPVGVSWEAAEGAAQKMVAAVQELKKQALEAAQKAEKEKDGG